MGALARLVPGLPLFLIPGLLAASAPAGQAAVPNPDGLAGQLARATAEARAAEAREKRLEAQGREAAGQAEKIGVQRAAAAEAIAAAEARISASNARLRLIAERLAERRRALEKSQAPAGALLAGLAMMAERPPILAVLDEGSTREFVRVRILLDSTLPEVRRRTAAMVAEIEQARRLQQAAAATRSDLVRQRALLDRRRRAFAALEEQALRLAEQRGEEALGAGDVALARSEEAEALEREQARGRSARGMAAELVAIGPAPARPGTSRGPVPPPLRYDMPADAPVIEGFGAIGPAGIRSRGLTLATARGTPVRAPASGTVRFAGAFRNYDGVVILDHGGGWMSLLLNVSTALEPGRRVERGQLLGRALGELGVELSRDGRRVSPALIAGSSQMLSNRPKQS